MIEWGLVRVAQALFGTDNAFSAVQRGDRAFVPVIFRVIFLVPVFDATIRSISQTAYTITRTSLRPILSFLLERFQLLF